MKFKTLGKTGIEVSELCLGTMTFGGHTNCEESAKIFHLCLDKGINFFDCADVYENGRSEEILGDLINGRRDELILTSKVYYPTGNNVNSRGGTRKHILQSIEQSLKRLKTDYIDLYFIHRFDEYTPIEETLRVFDDLVSNGKVLYLGASNFAAWQVAKALGISRENKWNRFECIQPMYNLVKRQAEVEILPMALSEQVGVVSYSPLGGGLFTGKYGTDKMPNIGRLVDNDMYKIRYGDPRMLKIADKFLTFSQKQGFSPVSLAIAWVSSHPAITSPIIGASNVFQLEESLRSIEINLTKEMRSQISSLSPTPPLATDRNDELSDHNYGHRK